MVALTSTAFLKCQLARLAQRHHGSWDADRDEFCVKSASQLEIPRYPMTFASHPKLALGQSSVGPSCMRDNSC